eukprot:3514316-Rhodomonas_salina.1
MNCPRYSCTTSTTGSSTRSTTWARTIMVQSAFPAAAPHSSRDTSSLRRGKEGGAGTGQP